MTNKVVTARSMHLTECTLHCRNRHALTAGKKINEESLLNSNNKKQSKRRSVKIHPENSTKSNLEKSTKYKGIHQI